MALGCNLRHQTSDGGFKMYQKCMDLQTQEASLAWTLYPRNCTIDMVFSGSLPSPSGWVGWGINPKSPNQMTNSQVLIAMKDPNTGQPILLPFVLDPSVKLQQNPVLSRSLDIPIITSSLILRGNSVKIFSLYKLHPNKTSLNHVWNRGIYVQGYSPTIHGLSQEDLKSTKTVEMLSGLASPNDYYALKTSHAIINSFSWGFLLLLGVITARYLKHFLPLDPSWFYMHVGVQVTGYGLGISGFAMGLKLASVSDSGGISGTHRKLGFAIVSLGTLQSVALFFRPKKTNKYRKYWKSYHHFVGYACVTISVVNVFQGFDLLGLSPDSKAKLVYCLVFSSLVGICAALEINSWVIYCRKKKEENEDEGGSTEEEPDFNKLSCRK
ncbi:hypothetical protein AMTR_s00055p00147440 [Amborella trichopoda]|uniref:Cytochrome b561 and DOMON domain-containing protein n=2 Tax=Amborella trichopoda TaxID=13333 RepID=U5D730_AMBTC|nr:hypothetical protein AMTR_s00055p00147440 [Amborella trichopoda]